MRLRHFVASGEFAVDLAVWVGVAVLVFCSSSGLAADVVTLEKPEKYIIKTSEPSVYSGTEKSGTASLGALIEVTHQRGPWRYAKAINGWIHEKNLVQLAQAVDEFTAQIQQQPTPNAYHLRGIAWMAAEKWGPAVNDLEEAYSLGDSSITLHMNLGMCYFNLNLSEKARSEFTSIIEKFPNEARAYFARGDLLLDLGELEPALKDLSRAIELQPEYAEAHNSLGVTLRLMKNYPDAIAAYDQCLKLDPDFMPAYVNRGFARKMMGQFATAIEDYEQALELTPDAPAVLNDLSWLLSTCENADYRDGEQAVKLALQACRATEYRNPEYLDTLAAGYASLGQFKEAVQTVETAIDLFAAGPQQEESRRRRELYQSQMAYVELITNEQKKDELD